jgi:hypothetical protein
MLHRECGVVLFAVVVVIGGVWATIDLNLQQLEYVADHLTKSDCRKLVAALHDPTFFLENNIDAAERKIPNDISCLKLLLHWNSQPGEGKGKSHVILVQRLKQLGHDNLAEWLSGTVFRQLEEHLNTNLSEDPFKELAQTNETEGTLQDTSAQISNEDTDEEEEEEWLPIDTIFCVLIAVSVSLIIAIPGNFAWKYLRRKMKKKKRKVEKRLLSQLGSAKKSYAETDGEDDGEMLELLHNTAPSDKDNNDIHFVETSMSP